MHGQVDTGRASDADVFQVAFSFSLICIDVLPTCICLVSESLGVELETAGSCHMGTRNELTSSGEQLTLLIFELSLARCFEQVPERQSWRGRLSYLYCGCYGGQGSNLGPPFSPL